MAMQRLTIATIAGDAANAVATLFESWQTSQQVGHSEVDCFCEQLRTNGTSLPIVYFCEWIDRWLMGDLVPGAGAVEGKKFQVACMSSEQALSGADRCGNQFQEQEWLACRLREAASGWSSVAEPKLIIVVREPLGASTTDDEVRVSLRAVPAWLSTLR